MSSSHPLLRALVRAGRGAAFAALTAMGAVSSVTALRAQTLSPAIAAGDAQAVHAMASVMQARGDRAHRYLQQIGYSPALPQETWSAFPAVRKIETAYLDYDRSGAQGGQKMLALLSKSLAQEYEAVRYEPALQPYLREPDAPLPRPTPAPSGGVTRELSAGDRNAVTAIAKYADGGALGGPQGVLRHHFGLTDNQTYDILRSSGSNEEALMHGLSLVPATQRGQRLGDLATTLQSVYESARVEPAITRVANAAPPTEHGTFPVTSLEPADASARLAPRTETPRLIMPPLSRSGSAVAAETEIRLAPSMTRAAVARSYNGFRVANYGAAEAGFVRMIGGARGFGGVVFGNDVRGPASASPSRVTWIADDRDSTYAATGQLVFTFPDGSERVMAPVLREDVFAARAMVFGGVANIPVAVSGEGIGLVGLHDAIDVFDVAATGLANERRRWDIVLHPALAGTHLGWAAIYADALPITHDLLVRLLRDAGETTAANRLQAYYVGDDLASTWKFTDAPLEVRMTIGTIQVARANAASRSAPAITVRGYVRGDESTPNFDGTFSQVLPALTRSVTAYARLDRFARTLGAMRWAKQSGATFVGSVSEPASYMLPGSVFVTGNAIAPGDAFSAPDEFAALDFKLRAMLDTLAAGDARLRQVSGAMADRLRRSDDARRQVWDRITQIDAYIDSVGRPGPLIAARLSTAPLATRQLYDGLETEYRRLSARVDTARGDAADAEARVRLANVRDRFIKLRATLAPEMAYLVGMVTPVQEAVDSLRVRDSIDISSRAVVEQLVRGAPAPSVARYDSLERLRAPLARRLRLLGDTADAIDDAVSRMRESLVDTLERRAPAVLARIDRILIARDSARARSDRAPAGSVSERVNDDEATRLTARADSILDATVPAYKRLRDRSEAIETRLDALDDRTRKLENAQFDVLLDAYPGLARWSHVFSLLRQQRQTERGNMRGRLTISG